MAKNKKKSTRKTYRRRRVSGAGSADIQAMGLAVAGALVAAKVSEKLASNTNESIRKIAPYFGVVSGAAIPFFTKNPMARSLSLGLVAGGAIPALKELKVLKGIGFTTESISGYAPLPYRVTGRQANVVNGMNWSGSGLSQAKVISGINQAASAVAAGY